jgi:hypothetical protein
MESWLGGAKNAGITEEDIASIQAIVEAVVISRIRSQFQEVQDSLRE